MLNWKRIGGSAVVAVLLCTTTARADVTAEQVWQSWVDYYKTMGADVTTDSVNRQGDTLVVTNAVFASTTPNGSFTAKIADVSLKESGGQVEITMSPSIPITVNSKDPAGKTTDVAIEVDQTNMTTTASGAPDDMTFNFKADQISVKLDSIKEDGKDVPVNAAFAMQTPAGTYHIVKQGGSTVESNFTAADMTMDVGGTDPQGSGTFAFKGKVAGLTGTSNAVIPDGTDMANMSAALTNGMLVKAKMDFGQGDYSFEGKNGDKASTGTASVGSGTFNVDMSKDGLTYGVGGTGAKVSVMSPDVPFPIDVSYGESQFNLTMPVSKSDTPQPFALLVKVVDLAVSEGIWGMIDPTTKLPHDPATVVVDVAGTAKMLVDIFDPKNAENPPAQPGQLESLNVNQLQVKAVGADLTGTGAVTFDNTTPVPMPKGSVDLKLVGGNALIDKLAEMGIVPQDQAAGAKMMLGMFTVPAGDDTLTSKIEFKDDGGIYANGQRLK